jgi:tripartite-type tricarboxylate transporter receptor subunit TctC
MAAGSWPVVGLIAAALVSGISGTVGAQTWPEKSIRIIVPFAPGGIADTSSRAVSDRLGARLGQSVIVENKPGASGNIGTEMVAKAAPDGYTLLLGFDGTMVVNPHTHAKLPFDTLRDFQPVTKLGDAPVIIIAHPSVPANSLRELIALSKAKPGTLSYGTAGAGTTPHLVGEMINLRAGTDFQHVPYKGGGQAMTDVIGGQIPLVITAVASSQQFIKAGKVKGLGISGSKRTSSVADVPTFIESGLEGMAVNSWTGILAPKATPRAIVDRLQREIAAVLQEPAVRERYAILGIEPVGNTPDEYAAQIRADLEQWGPIVKRAGIRID